MKDLEIIHKIAMVSGCLLNYADDLETKTFFRHELKKRTNEFTKFLRKFEDQILDIKDHKELSNELHNAYLVIDNLVSIQYNLKNDSQREYFNIEVNKPVDKLNLNTQV